MLTPKWKIDPSAAATIISVNANESEKDIDVDVDGSDLVHIHWQASLVTSSPHHLDKK